MPYAPRRRAPRRRLSMRRRASACGFALLSVACAAYLTWEFVGTSWVARMHQRAELGALTAAWGRHAPTARVGAATVEGILTIPRWGPAYAVPIVGGTDADSLAAGVGHMAGTAAPGDAGNVVLAGHRVTHGQPFYRMGQLRAGDRILIETYEYRYTYALDTPGSGLTLSATDGWVLSAAPRAPVDVAFRPDLSSTRLLTLVTCSELFHTSRRWVAFGHLLSRTPRLRGDHHSQLAATFDTTLRPQGAL